MLPARHDDDIYIYIYIYIYREREREKRRIQIIMLIEISRIFIEYVSIFKYTCIHR